MVVLQQEFAAAHAVVATVGTDVFEYEPFKSHQNSARPRKVKSVTITGSNAVNDMKMDLYYGPRLVASSLYNVATGLTTSTSMKIPIVGGDYCKPNEPIKLVNTDAGGTNPVNIKIEIT